MLPIEKRVKFARTNAQRRGRTVLLADLPETPAKILVRDVKHVANERKRSGPRRERTPNARSRRATPRPSVGDYEDARQDCAECPRRLCHGRHTRPLRTSCRYSALIYASSSGRYGRYENLYHSLTIASVGLSVCTFDRTAHTEMVGIQERPTHEHCAVPSAGIGR